MSSSSRQQKLLEASLTNQVLTSLQKITAALAKSAEAKRASVRVKGRGRSYPFSAMKSLLFIDLFRFLAKADVIESLFSKNRI